MKNLLFLLFILPTLAMVQPNMTGITQALREGNADALGAFFANSVEIAVIDQEDRYTKAEAVQVMKQFFSKYRPSNFNQVHKGVSRGGNLHYSIGEMQAAQKTFRVYLLLEDNGDKYLIQQLRIDLE